MQHLLYLIWAVGLASAANIRSYDFAPEAVTDPVKDTLPWLYSLSDSQQIVVNSAFSSYWTCSFLTGSDDHQYVLLGHTMWVGGVAQARASLLDATDPTYYKSLLYTEDGATVSTDEDSFNASVGGLGIRSLSRDQFSQIQSYSTNPRIQYDITVSATSHVLFNGGLGQFIFGNETCGEWGIPAAKTEGTFTARGKELTVDPERSFTWYDRQWGGSFFMGNYTWFQLHVPGTNIKGSIWAWNDKTNDKNIRIATFRLADGSHQVLSFNLTESQEHRYYSNNTGKTYPTRWELQFPGHGNITVTSVRDDQETYITTSTATTAYEGFSEFKVQIFGIDSQGYGLAEVVSF